MINAVITVKELCAFDDCWPRWPVHRRRRGRSPSPPYQALTANKMAKTISDGSTGSRAGDPDDTRLVTGLQPGGQHGGTGAGGCSDCPNGM